VASLAQPHRTGGATDDWRALYLVAAAASVILLVLMPVQIVVFLAWPPPLGGTAVDWFAVFGRSRLLGLLSLDLLLLVDQALFLLVFPALFVALRPAGASWALLGTVLGLAGTVVYFASGAAGEMLALSSHYAAAASDAQRMAYRAAGETVLAIYQGTAFDVSYLLQTASGLLLCWVMLRSPHFGPWPGWIGLLGFVVGLGLFVPGPVGIGLALFSVVFLWVWYGLLALAFLRLGRAAPPAG